MLEEQDKLALACLPLDALHAVPGFGDPLGYEPIQLVDESDGAIGEFQGWAPKK